MLLVFELSGSYYKTYVSNQALVMTLTGMFVIKLCHCSGKVNFLFLKSFGRNIFNICNVFIELLDTLLFCLVGCLWGFLFCGMQLGDVCWRYCITKSTWSAYLDVVCGATGLLADHHPLCVKCLIKKKSTCVRVLMCTCLEKMGIPVHEQNDFVWCWHESLVLNWQSWLHYILICRFV